MTPLQFSLEEAYKEACAALGEAIVEKRLALIEIERRSNAVDLTTLADIDPGPVNDQRD